MKLNEIADEIENALDPVIRIGFAVFTSLLIGGGTLFIGAVIVVLIMWVVHL